MFSCEICEIFKIIFFYRAPPVAASESKSYSEKIIEKNIEKNSRIAVALFHVVLKMSWIDVNLQ